MNFPIIDRNFWSLREVLVTGAGGFIGRRLVQYLIEQNAAKVVGLDHKELPHLNDCETVELDLTDRQQVLAFGRQRRFDIVFNLAGVIDLSTRHGVYHQQFDLHLQAANNLIDAFAGSGFDRFVQMGSGLEYGLAANPPHTTSTREMPISAYAVSKLAATRMIQARAASDDFPGIVLRSFNVYGLGQTEGCLIAMAHQAARQGAEFPTSPGEQTRDFMHIGKLVEDMLLATQAPVPLGTIFNLCSGVEITIKEILELLKSIYPAFKPQYGAVPYRKTDLMRSVGAPYRPISRAQVWDEFERFFRQPF